MGPRSRTGGLSARLPGRPGGWEPGVGCRGGLDIDRGFATGGSSGTTAWVGDRAYLATARPQSSRSQSFYALADTRARARTGPAVRYRPGHGRVPRAA